MKRHAELLQLSRAHHGALKLALAARLAAESGNARQIKQQAQRIVAAYSEELAPHFATEECDVLPFIDRAGRHDLVRRTLAEHAELRHLVAAMNIPAAAVLLRFADRMAAHVRFEERELFETAQSLLTDGKTQTFNRKQES